MQNTLKVILDTDIGSDIDDALALAYLLKEPRCRLMGVTTVTGEADLRAEMCSAICQNADRGDVPIHVGCDHAMLADLPQKRAAQAAALGAWQRRAFAPGNTALEFLRSTIRANPGEITLLAIGPMTNVGLLFAADPEIPALLGGLVLMCGVFFDKYPALWSEWNAKNDPHATAITYGNGFQKRPPLHTSFGLDVTGQCVLPADECRGRFKDIPVLAPVRDFAEVWFKDNEKITFHDPLAAVSIFHPDMCGYERGEVRVLHEGPVPGCTLFITREDGPHHVARTVDAPRFFETYLNTIIR